VKLRYSKRTREQIDKALAYVAERSHSGATKIEARISAILTLAEIQPQAGVRMRLSGVRRIFLTPYPCLVDCHADKDEIVVLRFRHTSRNPSSIQTGRVRASPPEAMQQSGTDPFSRPPTIAMMQKGCPAGWRIRGLGTSPMAQVEPWDRGLSYNRACADSAD
jgi:toxin ParE1/3/4